MRRNLALGIVLFLMIWFINGCAPAGANSLTKPLTPLETQVLVAATAKGWLTSHPQTVKELTKMKVWLKAMQTTLTTSTTDLGSGIQHLSEVAPAGWGDLVAIAIVMFGERSGMLDLARAQKTTQALPYLEAIFVGVRSVIEGQLPAPGVEPGPAKGDSDASLATDGAADCDQRADPNSQIDCREEQRQGSPQFCGAASRLEFWYDGRRDRRRDELLLDAGHQ